MRPDGDPDLIPFFGCLPHTPDRVLPAAPPAAQGQATRADRRAAGKCPTCGGRPAPPGAPFVCMGCHRVAPALQDRFDSLRVEAISTREPERNLLVRAAREKAGNRFVLTPAERSELMAEFPELAGRWLDSIGQPAPSAADADADAKRRRRRERREAKARAELARAATA